MDGHAAMSLGPGHRLGPYEIVAPLGAGGMGEVYRARDPRLERDVAIKVLPEHFLEDADSLSRFQSEAKAIASLSHRLEDWMEPLRAGAEFDRSQLDLLAEAISSLEEMVACVDESGTPDPAREDLLLRLAQKREAATAIQPGLKKKLPRPRRRRSLARFAFARRRSTASWPR